MSKQKILLALRNLYPHCRHFMNRQPEEVRVFLTGYLSVLERGLGDLDKPGPAEWIDRACSNWLDRLQEHDGRFPTPDQVRDLAKAYSPKADDKPDNRPWHEIPKAEYDALTMREKVRYLTILADKFGGQAGPMFAKHKGEGPVFPERHAKYKPMETRVRKEIDRLQKIIAAKRAADAGSIQLGSGSFTRFINEMPFGDAA